MTTGIPNMSNHARIERKALRVSMYGTLVFVAMAFAFALITQSNAILFDGIYSLLMFTISLITIQVAKLAQRPDDDKFHFGYANLEPVLNVVKSMFIVSACTFAGIESINRLAAGGNAMNYDIAVIYGVLATLGCIIGSVYLRRASTRSRSSLVRVDAAEWLISALLSGGVMCGFIVAAILSRSEFAHLAGYVDPVLVLALTVFALPVPIKLFWENFREIIAMAPPAAEVDELETQVRLALSGVDFEDLEIRVLKRGRDTFLLIHVIVGDRLDPCAVSSLDKIRDQCWRFFKNWRAGIYPELVFVADPYWAE